MEIPDGFTAVLLEKGTNILLLGLPEEKDYEKIYQTMKNRNVKVWFIACEIPESISYFTERGIEIVPITWEDGAAPPKSSVDAFVQRFNQRQKNDEFIAVACRQGFGRAPTIGTIALIENGFKPAEAILLVRKINKEFITEKQKQFLLSYQPQKSEGGCCEIF